MRNAVHLLAITLLATCPSLRALAQSADATPSAQTPSSSRPGSRTSVHAIAVSGGRAWAAPYPRRRRAHGAHQQPARQHQPPARSGAASGCASGSIRRAAHTHRQRHRAGCERRQPRLLRFALRLPALHPRRRRRSTSRSSSPTSAAPPTWSPPPSLRSAHSRPTSSPPGKTSSSSPTRPSTTRSRRRHYFRSQSKPSICGRPRKAR